MQETRILKGPFLRVMCPRTLAVCLYRNATKCLRPCACVRLEHTQPKGKTREEKRVSPLSRRPYISRDRLQNTRLTLRGKKIKCADVVGNTRHMISLSNRFPKLINLPTSTTFWFRNKWVMDPFVLEFFALCSYPWPCKRYRSINPILSNISYWICR